VELQVTARLRARIPEAVIQPVQKEPQARVKRIRKWMVPGVLGKRVLLRELEERKVLKPRAQEQTLAKVQVLRLEGVVQGSLAAAVHSRAMWNLIPGMMM
jgi:hypothetical protein